MTFDDITPGNSYACKFRTTTLCNDEGAPVDTRNIQLGQRVQGKPMTYEGIGIIRVRDTESRMLRVVDSQHHIEFVVPETDTWDYDTVHYK